MDEAGFTKGPWRVAEAGSVDMLPEGSTWSMWAGLGFSGTGPNPSGQDPRAERDANANLIAAAPDLYEALRQIVYDWDGEPEDVFDAQIALAKARGESALSLARSGRDGNE